MLKLTEDRRSAWQEISPLPLFLVLFLLKIAENVGVLSVGAPLSGNRRSFGDPLFSERTNELRVDHQSDLIWFDFLLSLQKCWSLIQERTWEREREREREGERYREREKEREGEGEGEREREKGREKERERERERERETERKREREGERERERERKGERKRERKREREWLATEDFSKDCPGTRYGASPPRIDCNVCVSRLICPLFFGFGKLTIDHCKYLYFASMKGQQDKNTASTFIHLYRQRSAPKVLIKPNVTCYTCQHNT